MRLQSQFMETVDWTTPYSSCKRIHSVLSRTLIKIMLYSYINEDYSSRSMNLIRKKEFSP